jgi:pimeloyl-ACP methyl ester carboxylesterase
LLERRKNGWMFWMKGGLRMLLMGLPSLAMAGIIFQLVTTKRDQRKLDRAPGEMVSVGNHELHIRCMGEGSPTVILESGSPATSIEWSAWVQPEVAKATRVCAYDRAGLGWSEAGPTLRDAEQITSELHTLLENAGIEGPYVLVGHSVGGHHVRVYAERYPDEVAGMVLVDATHQEQFERVPGMESGRKMLSVLSRVGPVLTATGVIRLSGMFPPTSDLPPLHRKHIENLTYQTPHLIAAFKEYGALPKAMEQARSTEGLGDKPLAVVSASDHGGGMMAHSGVEAEQSEQAAQTLQSELANLSSNSTRRVIEGSDHGSVITNQHHAQQTSEEILKLVEAVRTGQSLEEQ